WRRRLRGRRDDRDARRPGRGPGGEPRPAARVPGLGGAPPRAGGLDAAREARSYHEARAKAAGGQEPRATKELKRCVASSDTWARVRRARSRSEEHTSELQ